MAALEGQNLLATQVPDLRAARRIIIKIGSALLVDQASGLRADWLASLAQDVAWLRGCGIDVVIVSSGAIALGRQLLGLSDEGVLSLEYSQAAAAVGQIRLARAYEEILEPHGITTAQVLITLQDTQDRRRYLNVRATLEALLSFGVVPIVNENDTVATDEIRFGDNDRLAAQMAVTVGADQMILLSDVDGFYSANPQQDPTARRLDVIAQITPEIEAMAGDPVSRFSKGGMKTKLMAAKTAVAGGCAMAIAAGQLAHPLRAIAEGRVGCSWFLADADPHVARKRWINAMKPRGDLRLDAGAIAALQGGKSLLPAGVLGVTGEFDRGAAVSISGPDGVTAGKGLVRYSSDEARAIAGCRSGDIAAVLGYAGRAALVHRDDMVI